MWDWYWYVISLFTVLIVSMGWVIYVALKRIAELVGTLEALEHQIEESLDVLDSAYRDISRSARTEVLSDEPVVRRVVNALKASQEAVHRVANLLVSFGQKDEK